MTTTSSTAAAPCQVCGISSTTRCSLCRIVHYCSLEHSQSVRTHNSLSIVYLFPLIVILQPIQDWISHQIHCYVQPPKKYRANESTLRFELSGLLFPEDEDTPRVIKVKGLKGPDGNGRGWQTLNLKPYLPDDEKKGRDRVKMDGAWAIDKDGIALGRSAELYFRHSFLNDGSKINRCIQHITSGKMAMPWAGPFIAFRHSNAIWDDSLNVVMDEDLPVMIDYFRTGRTRR